MSRIKTYGDGAGVPNYVSFSLISFAPIAARLLVGLPIVVMILTIWNAPVMAQRSVSKKSIEAADLRPQSGTDHSFNENRRLAQEQDNFLGPSGAPISIVEYSSFRCLYCARASIRMTRLVDLYPNQVKVIFKHFPPGFSAKAMLAHNAALAAGAQGRFWEMHDVLFANQKLLERGDLIDHARGLNLDLERFVADLDGGKFQPIIDRDREAAKRQGVTGTPTFFINGHKLLGVRPLSEFTTIIDRELRRMRAESAGLLADRSGRVATAGPADAPVTIGVFADFQSPLSAQAAALLRRLGAEHPRELRLFFKSFPLAFHKQAKLAHQAALAAGAQGRFWEMHDLLFGHQRRLSPSTIEAHATRLGLDMKRFRSALRNGRYLPVVRQDMMDGLNREVRGVPTIFVNGRKVEGLPNYEELKAMIEEELLRVGAWNANAAARLSVEIGG